MMIARASAMVALCAAATSSANPPPFEIKGIRMRMPEAELFKLYPNTQCEAEVKKLKVRPPAFGCSLGLTTRPKNQKSVLPHIAFSTVADESVSSIWMTLYPDGTVEELSVSFSQLDRNNCETVAETIKSKYGKPESSRVPGAIYFSWHSPLKDSIRLSCAASGLTIYARDLKVSGDREWRRKLAAEIDQRNKVKKDL